MTIHQYNRVIDEAYMDLYRGIPLDDDEAREKIWKPIREFASTLDIPIDRTIKSISSKVQECKNQLSGIVSHLSLILDCDLLRYVRPRLGQLLVTCRSWGSYAILGPSLKADYYLGFSLARSKQLNGLPKTAQMCDK